MTVDWHLGPAPCPHNFIPRATHAHDTALHRPDLIGIIPDVLHTNLIFPPPPYSDYHRRTHLSHHLYSIMMDSSPSNLIVIVRQD